MADINQFQRSKDRINEILHHLMCEKDDDPETASYIKTLEMSIRKLDIKMKEHRQSPGAKNDRGLYDLSF